MSERALWLAKVPSNINPLSPTGFRLHISNLPEMEFFCQEVNIPDITLGEVNFDNPLSRTPLPGDKLDFGNLEVQFLVDEDMKNYKAVWNWMIGLGFPRNWTDYQNYSNRTNQIQQNKGVSKDTTDATLAILTNNSNQNIIINLRGLFPVSLGGLTFSSTDGDVNFLVGRASFAFDYYEFS